LVYDLKSKPRFTPKVSY